MDVVGSNENGSWVVDNVTYSDGVSTRMYMTKENSNAIIS